VRFRVHADRTAFCGRRLERVVEPGELEVLVGSSATDLPCRSKITLTGPTRIVGHDRRLVTPVELSPLELAPADRSPADRSPADRSPADRSPADRSPAEPAQPTPAEPGPAD
jgi:hypothetical protein